MLFRIPRKLCARLHNVRKYKSLCLLYSKDLTLHQSVCSETPPHSNFWILYLRMIWWYESLCFYHLYLYELSRKTRMRLLYFIYVMCSWCSIIVKFPLLLRLVILPILVVFYNKKLYVQLLKILANFFIIIITFYNSDVSLLF